MKAAVLFVLAFVLSGIPATAVVCDLWLCEAPAAELGQGCHEHGGSSGGGIITGSTRGCTHLADSAVFVGTSPRVASDAGRDSFAPAPPGLLLNTPAVGLLRPAYAAPPHLPLVLRI